MGFKFKPPFLVLEVFLDLVPQSVQVRWQFALAVFNQALYVGIFRHTLKFLG